MIAAKPHKLLHLALFLGLLGSASFEPLEGLPGLRSQLIDVNEDDWLDLVLSDGSVYLNREGRRFEKSAPLASRCSFPIWGDLNNDGHLDAVAVNRKNGEHLVLRGNGTGRFDEVATLPGGNTLGAVTADLDLDGRLDLAFGQAYVAEKKSYEAEPMRVYQGLTDRTAEWGFHTPGPPGAANGARPLYGLTAADVNNDGYPELLGAAYGRQWNTCWMRTPQQALYSECAAKYGIDGDSVRHGQYPANRKRQDELPFRSNGNTFSLAPGDFDGDGDLDLCSSEITHAWAGESSDLSAVLVNRLERFGEPFFERQTLLRDRAPQGAETWNQGDLQAHWADLDNDGRLDLIVCESDYPHNRLRIFRQTDSGFAEDRQAPLWPNCPGIALGDVDRDGDLDMIATGTRTRWPEARPKDELALWRNDESLPSLEVRLEGSKANRSAIGARAVLETDRGRQVRELTGAYGHCGQQTMPGRVHFGLGAARPLRLKVIWPDRERSETVLTDLPSRGTIRVLQR